METTTFNWYVMDFLDGDVKKIAAYVFDVDADGKNVQATSKVADYVLFEKTIYEFFQSIDQEYVQLDEIFFLHTRILTDRQKEAIRSYENKYFIDFEPTTEIDYERIMW